jgi:hypothetical protein
MVDDLLINMTFVKVKISPEFRRTRPPMSQCILKLQIDFPAIGLDPKAQRNLSKHATPRDLPPVVVTSFKLGWGSSQARDPGGA